MNQLAVTNPNGVMKHLTETNPIVQLGQQLNQQAQSASIQQAKTLAEFKQAVPQTFDAQGNCKHIFVPVTSQITSSISSRSTVTTHNGVVMESSSSGIPGIIESKSSSLQQNKSASLQWAVNTTASFKNDVQCVYGHK